jgi:hypothetical protein
MFFFDKKEAQVYANLESCRTHREHKVVKSAKWSAPDKEGNSELLDGWAVVLISLKKGTKK